VSRIKNLSGALRFLCGVSGEVSLEIFGPLEDREYWQECEVLIAGLPSNIEVRYCGEIDHDGVWEVFSAHELLLLPTLGENFGHVILEALASGCPVLISDRTPWRNLEAEGVGWDIPLDETDRFRAALQSCVDGDGVWFERMSSRARDFANRHASDPVIAAANRHLLEGAINLAAASRRPRSGR
jgi:glycosyltransferase involved in cell wall biosynthesis